MRSSSEEEIKLTLVKEEERKLSSEHLLALIHFTFPFIVFSSRGIPYNRGGTPIHYNCSECHMAGMF